MRAHYCFTPLRILSARSCPPALPDQPPRVRRDSLRRRRGPPVFPDQSPRMRRDSLWRTRHAVSPVAGADHSRQRMVCVSPLDCRAVTYTGIILELTDNGLYCAGGDFYVDPWRPVDRAVITHAHSDHACPGSRAYL